MASNPRDKSEFRLVFRGVRGSYPTSGKQYLKYGGCTTCYEVWAGNCLIIIDAGTGIVSLGNELLNRYSASGHDAGSRTPIETIIIFSHVHADHIQGLAFFTPAFMPDSTIYLYGPDTSQYTFEEAITSAIMPPYYPISINDMYSLKLFRSISQVESIYWSPKRGIPDVVNNFREPERKKQAEKSSTVRISFMKSYAHPYEGVLIIRVEYNGKSIVVATDIEGYVNGDTRLIDFSRDADLLLHDVGYTTEVYKSLDNNRQGYGHSTVKMAVEVAERANVKRLALVHHEPANDDKIVDSIDKESKKLFPRAFAAHEGQEITL